MKGTAIILDEADKHISESFSPSVQLQGSAVRNESFSQHRILGPEEFHMRALLLHCLAAETFPASSQGQGVGLRMDWLSVTQGTPVTPEGLARS